MALHLRGVLLPDDQERDLWLDGDRVSFDPVPGAQTIADRGYILPGLVDCHCHIGIALGAAPVTSLEQAKQLAVADRDAGVLAIRDAGSPYPYPHLDDDPDVPRLARAGRHLAPIKRYLRGVGLEVSGADLPAAAADQARAGNGWVKLVGDWIDRGVGDLAPAFSADEMTAAIDAAHAAGVRVAVHTFGEEAVEIVVRAGVDSVEHGTGLSPDLIDLMARQGTALVPTMLNVDRFEEIAAQAEQKFPRYAAHMRSLRSRFPAVVAAAREAGVPIYAGTDAGGGIGHGRIAEELLLLAESAGMPPEEVLRAGSWGAREWLGFSGPAQGGPAQGGPAQGGPAQGGLTEGGRADLTIYPTDPREDLRVLAAPQRIVLRGQVVR
jgi:imidazolonepropionase-like amidohydrolase